MVTKVVQGGFRSISEELFDVVSPNLVYRNSSAKQRPDSKGGDLFLYFKVMKLFVLKRFLAYLYMTLVCAI